jgi:hypothetical protein
MKYKDNTIVGIYENFPKNLFLDIGVFSVLKIFSQKYFLCI